MWNKIIKKYKIKTKICFVSLIIISNNYINNYISFFVKYINIKFKYILNKLNRLLIYILIYIFRVDFFSTVITIYIYMMEW